MDEQETREAAPRRSAIDRAIGLSMWVPGLAWLTGMMSTLMVAQRFFTADQVDWLTRIYTRGQLKVLGTGVDYVVHPEVDRARPYMFVQNHVNLLDHCTVYDGTPHFKQGIELASHFEIPVYGWFMKQRGTIPVYRGASAAKMHRGLLESVRDEVHKGHSILVFPEGTRTRNGRVGPFHSGLFRIAHTLELPIVPVAVTGMFEVLRKGEPYIRPGHRVTVYLERPVETKGVRKSELPQLIEQVHRTIAARVDAHYDGPRAAEPNHEAHEDTSSTRRA